MSEIKELEETVKAFQEIHEYAAKIEGLLHEAVEMLKGVHWYDCPECLGDKKNCCHTPNCRLTAFLKKVEE